MNWLPDVIDAKLARRHITRSLDDVSRMRDVSEAAQGQMAMAVAEAVRQHLQDQDANRQPPVVIIKKLVVKVQLNYCTGTRATLSVRNGSD